ncbi:MAG: CBS domain-containing protein [Planctomycetota bacterium]|nr:CBS domain-containing protein [Planctomycetota bacterium]
MHEMRRALAGVRVKDGMVTDFLTLAPGDPLGLAIERLLRGSQQDFPVLEDGRVIGLLTRQNLIRALAEGRGERTVGEAMEPPAAPLETEAPLEDAMRRMNENGSRTLPVVREGRLVGLLTAENLSELLTIRNAMSEAAAR